MAVYPKIRIPRRRAAAIVSPALRMQRNERES
jgi:hypothetical protein